MVDAAGGGDCGGELKEEQSVVRGWMRRVNVSEWRREGRDYFSDGGSDKSIVETCCQELVDDSCWATVVWRKSEVCARDVLGIVERAY